MSLRRQRRLSAPGHRAQWPLLIALILGIVAIIALWFTLASPLDTREGQETQRYVEAIVGTPSRVNPLFAHLNDADRDLTSLIFSGLTRLGPAGEILPDLAESWEISEDGRTYTFHLRPGVVWHTGAPFTAEDVVFTFQTLANPDVPTDPSLRSLWSQVSCQAPDDLTVQCQLPNPYAPFLAFTTVGILPRHVLEAVEPSQLFESPFNQAPVGTGPFRIVYLDQAKALLKANERFYLGRPEIDEIEFRFYPDPPTAAAALSRREVQGLLLGPAADRNDYQLLSSDSRLRAYTATRTAYTILYLNNGRPPFDSRKVRQAVARAIDFEAIIGNLLEGHGVRALSPIVPGTWAYNPDLKPPSRDLDEARRLLDEAGWKEGENGLRSKEGTELQVSLLTDEDPLRGAIAEEIARQMEEVGFQVTVVRQGASDLVQDFLLPRQYQAAIFGWDPGPDPDPYPAWHSSQIGDDGRNLAGYISEDADRVLEESRKTTDIDKRQALYYTFQQIFSEDLPSVLLYYPVYTYFVSQEVENIQMGILFHSGSRFFNVWEWSIKETGDLAAP